MHIFTSTISNFEFKIPFFVIQNNLNEFCILILVRNKLAMSIKTRSIQIQSIFFRSV